MSQGLSYETFAAVIGVSRQTLYDWEKAHPQFLDTKKKAVDACLLFWETLGIKSVSGGKAYNPASWIYNMKCRFPKDGWNPRTGIDISDEREGFEA